MYYPQHNTVKLIISIIGERKKQKNTQTESLIRQASGGPKKNVSIRARYWAYLFENLRRAVDEIYTTCEGDASVMECKVSDSLWFSLENLNDLGFRLCIRGGKCWVFTVYQVKPCLLCLYFGHRINAFACVLQEVLLVLDNYRHDFQALINWINLQERLENAGIHDRYSFFNICLISYSFVSVFVHYLKNLVKLI